jgi:hypothetical protein
VTVTYTLHLVHALSSNLANLQLTLFARSLAAKFSRNASDVLLPGETLIATITHAPHSVLLRTTQSLSALTALIDDFRIFMRLWALLDMWSWGVRLWRAPPADAVLRGVAYAQVGTMVLYQYLENGAYLASKGVLGFNRQKIARLYAWSSRFWAAYVLLEFGRLARVRALRKAAGPPSRGEEKEGKMEREKEEAKWWRELYANAAWAPLTIHWSTEAGWASEGQVAVLGLIAGWLGLREAWKETA